MFYIVDKPIGPSSNQLLSHLKKYFGVRRAGHSGTLDPLASGLLILALGNSTKLLPYVTASPKVYEFTFDISNTNDSLDLDTPLRRVEYDTSIFWNLKKIDSILENFKGEISQIPPLYSAIRIDGKRSYLNARRSSDFAWLTPISARQVTIDHLELMSLEIPYITMRASVSEGTYIRALARDIWAALGGWAVVTKLRRTHIAQITVPNKGEMLELHPWEFTLVEKISARKLFPHISFFEFSGEVRNLLDRGIAVTLSWVVLIQINFSNAIYIGTLDDQPYVICELRENMLHPIKGNINIFA